MEVFPATLKAIIWSFPLKVFFLLKEVSRRGKQKGVVYFIVLKCKLSAKGLWLLKGQTRSPTHVIEKSFYYISLSQIKSRSVLIYYVVLWSKICLKFRENTPF